MTRWAKCGARIEWLTLAGSRVFRTDKLGRPVYETRCACGVVKRTASGATLSTRQAAG